MDHDAARDYDSSGGLKQETLLRTAKELQDSAIVALTRHHSVMNLNNISENIAAMERLRRNLQKRNIRLILVTAPVTPLYREGVQATKYSSMQHALDTFCNRNRVEYRNYFADERFTLNDFLDADHLNHNGAVKFSEYLAKEVLHPN